MKVREKYVFVYENSNKVLSKQKSGGFLVTGLPTNVFLTLHSTLLHNIIKEKLDLTERTFKHSKRKIHFILPLTIRRVFSLLRTKEGINFGLFKMYVTLLFDNNYLIFGTK